MTLPREASPTFDRALTIPCFQDRRDSKKTYRERSMPIFLRITIEIIKQIYIYISRVTNKRILFSFFETTRHVPTCYTAVNLAHAYKDFPLIKKKRREKGRGGGRQRKKLEAPPLRGTLFRIPCVFRGTRFSRNHPVSIGDDHCPLRRGKEEKAWSWRKRDIMLETKRRKEGREESSMEDAWNPGIQDGWW